MNFFNIALEELDVYISEQIRYNSLSHRLSKLENKEFDNFMTLDTKNEKKPQKIIVDHEAQIKQAMG